MIPGNLATAPEANSLSKAAAQLGIEIYQAGKGKPILLLHGGGGPVSIAQFAETLSGENFVIAPVHPGFSGTTRPTHTKSVKDLARTYVDLLTMAGLTDVLVVGFSMGGWIAAEMATIGGEVMGSLVLVDAVGIEVPGQSILDIFSIAPSEIADFSYHEPNKYRIDLARLTPDQAAMMRANFETLAVYSQTHNMQDPTLRQRLATVNMPVNVVWGESDRVATPDYGRSFAAAFPDHRFSLIPQCGHLPQIEQPQKLLEIVRNFSDQA
jgi:pimeloyl-ACP methyl ester carboxylesterase